MTPAVWLLLFAIAWVGHACILTAALNNLYGRPLPKWFLRPYRYAIGAGILAFPALVWSAFDFDRWAPTDDVWAMIVGAYGVIGVIFGAIVLPIITVRRLLRPTVAAVLAERTETVDFWPILGRAAIGDGKNPWMVRLPFTDAFHVDFTELTLAVPRLPKEWDGLTLLLLSDLHFHGTPSRAFFEAVFDRLAAQPAPDLVVLAGDYLDTDTHHTWLAPLFGKLTATHGKFAILGNHDEHHTPDTVRVELEKAGYTVVSNRWTVETLRGAEVVIVGHEGPWFTPPPDVKAAPERFRLCISHSPDNFYWGQAHGIDLMLCGHVHGGQIRVPLIGSIFIPSIYGRRFDMGVFEENGMLMVIGRGLSGKEPLRFRCRPQVLRLTLRWPERA